MHRIVAVVALFAASCGWFESEPTEPPAPEPAPAPAPPPAPAPAANVPPALLDPSAATEQAPERFKVRFETTKGAFVVDVHRDWSPNGADRFYNLVRIGYYDGVKFFRAIDGFMVQFGINGYGSVVNDKWRPASIPDDPVKEHNTRGRVTFAKTGAPNSRTTQIFVNYGDNRMLDGQGFSPFGEVVEGMDIVDSLYKGYGEGAPRGAGPDQGRVQSQGNAYLEAQFPKLDGVVRATVL